VNVPGVGNRVLNDPPGRIVPELQPSLSAVEVCTVMSTLRHVTVPPTATTIGFELNAVNVRKLALIGIIVKTRVGGGDVI